MECKAMASLLKQEAAFRSGPVAKRVRVSLPQPDEAQDQGNAVSSTSVGSRGSQLAELPQDLFILICQTLGPHPMAKFLAAGRRTQGLSLNEEVWRFFCRSRWSEAANLGTYKSARDLYLDCNGWWPERRGRRQNPRFEAHKVMLHDSPCLTMDMRMTKQEIVTVSEAPSDENGDVQTACIHIIDHDSLQIRQRIEVSKATVNCCDVSRGTICLGSDDSKVRLYRQGGISEDGCSGSPGHYNLACEYLCASEVNDLRYTREDHIVAVRTHHNRHPAGLDVIPVERPDARISLQGGIAATRGKYIHALDGFEDGCSLNAIVCSAEDVVTSAFSAMLFDFRCTVPCVADLPVTYQQQGQPGATMLWPLRAGRAGQVYANLLDDSRLQEGGLIAMVDFRYPSIEVADLFRFSDPVDDFRCLDGSIYAACTEHTPSDMRIILNRCTYGSPGIERLCTVVEAYDAGGRLPKEDLKIFSICASGFAMTSGGQLSVGHLAEPCYGRGDSDLSSPASLRAPRSVRSQRGLLISEDICSF